MAGAGERKGKKDDNGIGTAIDFVLSNARLVLGVGGAAMLGIATLAVKRVSACSLCQGWERGSCLHSAELVWHRPGRCSWSRTGSLVIRWDLRRVQLRLLLGLYPKEVIGDTNKDVYPSG